MTSAGLNREYILSIPSNYDQSHPYRLLFGMHWMGGSDGAVSNDGQSRSWDIDMTWKFITQF